MPDRPRLAPCAALWTLTLSLTAALPWTGAEAQMQLEASDTLFNRFLQRTVVAPPGSQKVRIMYLAGDSFNGAGVSGSVPWDLEPPRGEGIWLSHDLSTLAYRLAEPGGGDDGPASFSASYGLGLHRVPYLGNVHAGAYFNYASTPREAPERGDDSSTRLAPYLYLDRGHTADAVEPGLTYAGFLLPNGDFSQIDKALLELGWRTDALELGLWYEFTRLGAATLHEYSVYGRLVEPGPADAGLRWRLGNAFPDAQDITGTFTDPERLFAVVDLSYLFVLGLSYRDDLGLGIRAGVDYTLDVSDGETLTAQLYYAHDYINDLVLGQIADPSMWVIGVGYTR